MFSQVTLHTNSTSLVKIQRTATARFDASAFTIQGKQAAAYSGLQQLSSINNDISQYASYVSDAKAADNLFFDVKNNLTDILSSLDTMKTYAVLAKGVNASEASTLQTDIIENFDGLFKDLIGSINASAQSIDFQNMSVLEGEMTNQSFTVGPYVNETITVGFDSATPSALSLGGLSLDSVANSDAAIKAIDAAITTVQSQMAYARAGHAVLESTSKDLYNYSDIRMGSEDRNSLSYQINTDKQNASHNDPFSTEAIISFLYKPKKITRSHFKITV